MLGLEWLSSTPKRAVQVYSDIWARDSALSMAETDSITYATRQQQTERQATSGIVLEMIVSRMTIIFSFHRAR